MFENATDARIGEITKDWFRYARDTDCGRRNREKSNKAIFCYVFIFITIV